MKPFGIFVSELIKQTSFTFKNKKSQWPWATGKVLNCGAGGIRTLVQTRNVIAFYMLSFCLDFRPLAGQKQPTYGLASLKVHDRIKALQPLCLLLRCLLVERRKPRPSRDILVPCLARN